jgi:signal transduction histidine kinase
VNKSISSITDAEGQIIHFVSVDEDITEKKRSEEELISAKERAEESDRLKSSFLANMSHEIRTPLNSIIGFSELLTDPDFDQERKLGFVSVIIENGNNLLTIINDILDISRLAAGKVRVHNTFLSVPQLIFGIQKELVFKAREKGIELIATLENQNDEVMFESDADRLKQIFYNLINNAIKFTESGYVEVKYTVKEKTILFAVKDTGIGIPHDFQEKIFHEFIQVESSLSRKHGGNGLGLSITKNLVELLKGKIWVESEPGRGSTFYFELPYPRVDMK